MCILPSATISFLAAVKQYWNTHNANSRPKNISAQSNGWCHSGFTLNKYVLVTILSQFTTYFLRRLSGVWAFLHQYSAGLCKLTQNYESCPLSTRLGVHTANQTKTGVRHVSSLLHSNLITKAADLIIVGLWSAPSRKICPKCTCLVWILYLVSYLTSVSQSEL